MTSRINPYANMDLVKPLIDYGQGVANSGLEKSLVSLVEIRASQINGCAICLDMHTRDAREAGETPERIWMLDAWRESPLYSAREKAALGWTDALTRLSETRAPDADYQALAAEFSEAEQVKLTLMIGVINSFNKLGVGFRLRPAGASRKAAA
jgi:AhpD family alkylhydroperoxidase